MGKGPAGPRAAAVLVLALPAAVFLLRPQIAFADVHKWVDDRGITHYSASAPGGRPSTNLGIATKLPPPAQAATTQCSTVQCQYERLRRDRLATDAAERSERELRARQSLVRTGARGMSFDVFARIDRGMAEAEVMHRAGPPDHVTYDGMGGRTWSYLPTNTDPYITSVVLRGGRVFEVQRTKQ